MNGAIAMQLDADLHDSYVARQIRRCTRTLLMVNAVILAVILLLAVIERQYVYAFVSGFFPLDRAGVFSPDPNTANLREPGYVALLFAGPLFLIAVWNIARTLRRYARPETHPIAVFLSARAPLNDVAREIEADLAAPIERLGRIIVTRSWILQPDLYMLHACHFRDVIWAYPKTTSYSAHGAAGINVHGVIIWDRYKRRIPIQCQTAHAGRLLELVSQRAVPRVIIGYSSAMAKRAKRDWDAVVEQVDHGDPRDG